MFYYNIYQALAFPQQPHTIFHDNIHPGNGPSFMFVWCHRIRMIIIISYNGNSCFASGLESFYNFAGTDKLQSIKTLLSTLDLLFAHLLP